MTGVELRPGRLDDVAAVRRVADRAYIRFVPRIGRKPAPMVADFQHHLRDDDVTVALCDGTVVGYVIGQKRDDCYFIENIAVDPTASGKGIGKALMQVAEDTARAAGRDTMALYTNVRMTENFPFYQYLGYRITQQVSEAGFRRVYFEKRTGT